MIKTFKISIITLLFLVSSNTLFGQKDSTISLVPHQISFELGYRYSFYANTELFVTNPITGQKILNQATNGIGMLADYGWQLSGLNGKNPAVYLTIPLGYSVILPDNSSSKRVSMLNYGWTVRHELKKSGKIVPFIGYGLFLNNLTMDGTSGSVTGHQTQFEGGVNFNTPTRLKYFVKLQVSYSSYPKLGDSKSLHFMYADLRFGVRI